MVPSLGCIWLRPGPRVQSNTVQKRQYERREAEREDGTASTNVERVAQGLGTLLEVEASCLLAFPMIYLLIATTLGRLRPDLALERPSPELGEEREEEWVAAGEPK